MRNLRKHTSRSAPSVPWMRVFLLGAFRVERDGQEIPSSMWRRRRAAELLTLLALARDHCLSRDAAIETLWPGKEPKRAAGNLHRALYDLRQVIGSEGVTLERGKVRLAEAVWTDVESFETANRDGTIDISEIIELYPGDLLPETTELEPVVWRREHLRRQFFDAALRLARRSRENNPAAAIAALRHAIAIDPAEETVLLLMQLLDETGRRREALSQFEKIEKVLRKELGTEPSRRLQEMAHSLRQSSPSPKSRDGWRRVASRLAGPATPRTMLGRSESVTLLHDFIEQESGTLLVVGEAGIGKTSLAIEGARLADAKGAITLSAVALEFARSIPYAPFVEAWTDHLRTAGAPPDENPFTLFAPTPGGNPQQDKLRLFQSVQRSLERLAGERPVLFILDDLNFADESSLHLFHYLARSTRTQRLMLLGTCREEEIALNPPLQTLVTTLYRERLASRIFLNRLDRATSRELAESIIGRSIGDSVLESIFRLTEGNPFYTEEVVRGMEDTDVTAPAIPPDLASVVLERVRALGEPVNDLLSAAAVIGINFQWEVALRVSDLDAGAAMKSLEQSLDARLVEEHDRGYRFRHALVRESLLERVPRARRSRLHARTAAALEELVADETAEHVEQIAHHYRAAGLHEKALPYLIAAGDRAAARLGLEEAVRFLEQAIDAREHLRLPPDQNQFRLLLRVGQMKFSLSNLDEAVRDLDRATELQGPDGWTPTPVERAKARRCAALALITAGDLTAADQRLSMAMNSLEGEPAGKESANVLYHLAQLRWHEGRHDEAYDVAQRCLQVAERLGSSRLIAKGYEILSLSCHSLGEWRQGIEFEERRQGLVGKTVDVAQAFDVHL